MGLGLGFRICGLGFGGEGFKFRVWGFKVALGVPLRVPSRFAVRFPLKGIRVSAF